MKPIHWLLLAGAFLTAQAQAEPCRARSGPGTAALLELYTSEGCSSCPPAERWLSSLDLRGEVVPLALHVDYWDGLGWKDPYAQRAFTLRQRQLAGLAGATFVYTPQVLLQGRDFRGWDSAAFESAVARIHARAARANLDLALRSVPGGKVEIEVSAELLGGDAQADAALYLAVYQNGLTSKVAAGENRGRTLRHDYVVRQWLGPFAFADGPRLKERLGLELPSGAAAGSWGVAALVQEGRDARVLQALSLAGCVP